MLEVTRQFPSSTGVSVSKMDQILEAAAPAGARAGPPGRVWGAPDGRRVAEPQANGLAERPSRAPGNGLRPWLRPGFSGATGRVFPQGPRAGQGWPPRPVSFQKGAGRPRLGRPGAQHPHCVNGGVGETRGTPALSEARGFVSVWFLVFILPHSASSCFTMTR